MGRAGLSLFWGLMKPRTAGARQSSPGQLCPRHDGDLREPLVRRQGSQVSMRVARGEGSPPGSPVPGILQARILE